MDRRQTEKNVKKQPIKNQLITNAVYTIYRFVRAQYVFSCVCLRSEVGYMASTAADA